MKNLNQKPINKIASMAKKNLPYLPLYTGDWIKDCNVLSLEAEAAWLRIIFKMFNGGKQSVYKVSTKALQNLWRVSDEKVFCIIEELQDNDICGIEQDDRYITFTSRRYEKENRISEIRKEAVSKRQDRNKSDTNTPTNDLQNAYKSDTNDVQNAEIEIENNNIDNNINNTTKKISSNTRGKNVFDFSGIEESFAPILRMWLDYKRGRGQTYKTQKSFELLAEQLAQLSRGDPKTAMLIVKQSMANNWAGLFELKTNSNGSNNGKNIGSKVHEVVTDPTTGDFSDDI